MREAPEPHVGLGFDRHDPTILARRDALSGFGRVLHLGELYEFPSSMSLPNAKRRGLLCDIGDDTATRILNGRDIERDGSIAPPGEDTVWAKAPNELRLTAGDLVMRTVYAPSDPNGLVIGVITPEDLPIAASDSLIVMRPRTTLTSQQTDFTITFLRTPLARTLLGTSGSRVTKQSLAKLPVPQPDRDLTETLDELTVAKERFKAWQTEAESLLNSVFLDETPAAARTRIIKAGRALRLKVEAASLLDDLGHTIRTRFPYPIAARWRDAEALRSTGSTADAYTAVLDAAEILLCYAAQLALALTKEEGVALKAVEPIKTKLHGGRSGPGMGDWVTVLRETATSKMLRSLPPAHPLNDLRGLLDKEHIEGARQRLSARRNDQAHLRRVDQVDLPQAIHEAFKDLKNLMDAAQFLADWPLVHVTEVHWDSLTRTSRVRYRELMGDHPVVPTRTETHANNDVEVGSLYLRGHERQLHLLRPFLIGRDCPICRTWSTFHVDRAPTTTVVLKSLEHGHTVENATLADVIRAVGIL